MSIDQLVDAVLWPLRSAGSAQALAVFGNQAGGVALRAVLATLLVVALGWVRGLGEEPRSRLRRTLAIAGNAVVGLATFALLDSVLKNRADSLIGALGRWDHWALCALGGHLLGLASHAWRTWVIVAASFLFVGAYVGGHAVLVTLVGCLAGWAAIRFDLAQSPTIALAAQPFTTLGVVVYLWMTRVPDPLPSIQGWGLACWALMRHVSFVVEARAGASTRLRDYLCYILFFPSCFGAMETYDEFAAKNLAQREPPDVLAAVLGSIRGDVLIRCALLVPSNQEAWLASAGFFELWGHSLLLFLRGAFFLAGVWSTIEAGALLLGFRLRPNFTGVLTAQNPSSFWRAWRGTMTHWLIRYVYVPLGGNRHHRTRNILAAFAASTAWHMAGVLFVLPPTASAMALLPVLTWGTANAVGVAVHSAWRRRWPAGTWLPADALVTRAGKMALTLCFGSLTVSVLGFPRDHVDAFPRIACTLVGLGHVCGG